MQFFSHQKTQKNPATSTILNKFFFNNNSFVCKVLTTVVDAFETYLYWNISFKKTSD